MFPGVWAGNDVSPQGTRACSVEIGSFVDESVRMTSKNCKAEERTNDQLGLLDSSHLAGSTETSKGSRTHEDAVSISNQGKGALEVCSIWD